MNLREAIWPPRQHWPLWLALVALWGATAAELAVALAHNGGVFTYAFDDAYIHMAMARSFAQAGVWGVTADSFTSCSSSLLWTLGLAAVYKVAGVHDSAPLWINLLLATAIVMVVYDLLRTRGATPRGNFVVLLAIIFAAPLPTLILCGMEHVAHALLCILFLHRAALVLSRGIDDTASRTLHLRYLIVLAPLLVMTRFEGLFAIFIVGLLLLWQRRLPKALLLGLAGALPVVIYGAISLRQGWYALPNSILLKGAAPDVFSGQIAHLLLSTLAKILLGLDVCALGCAAALLLLQARRNGVVSDSLARQALFIFLAIDAMHIVFAKNIVWFRYEGYLGAAGVFVLALAAQEGLFDSLKPMPGGRLSVARAGQLMVVAVLLLGPCVRAARGLSETSRACTNVFEQQYQMARFLARYYDGKTVVLNDIGAPAYYANIKIVDLVGLSTLEVMQERRRHRALGSTAIADISQAHGATIAIVYDKWFRAGNTSTLPRAWQRLGDWTMPNNVVCGDAEVAFYAVERGAASTLAANLRAFAPELPREIVQRGGAAGPVGRAPRHARP